MAQQILRSETGSRLMVRARKEKIEIAGVVLTLIVASLVLPTVSLGEKPNEAFRPNIVYLHVHDMGRYCQPYGYAIPTPVIQRLAEEGMLFYNVFSAGPTCSPSRAALLTGRYPHNCGMTGLAHRGWKLNNYKRHIIHTLKKAGYYSVLLGGQHVAPDTRMIGYDETHTYNPKIKKYPHIQTIEATEKWFRKVPKQPFFAAVGFGLTHRDFVDPGPEDDPRYTRPPEPLPNTPVTRRDMASYNTHARELDKMYDRVFKAMKEGGVYENSLIICTTDHGIAFPSMKCNLTDHGTGVMLIMRGPGGFLGGKTTDAMISQMDIFPTLCDLLNIEKPDWLQGKSFMPILNGEKKEINEQIFTEVNYHAAYEPLRAVRTKRWKYIRRYDDRNKPVLANCDNSPSKDVWLKHGWKNRDVPKEQLYDLIYDPIEVNNLAYHNDPEIQKVLQDMRQRLDKWMQQTDDPLLKGPIPPPAGCVYNDPDDVSPQMKYFYMGPEKKKISVQAYREMRKREHEQNKSTAQ